MIETIARLILWSSIILFTYIIFGHGLILILITVFFKKPIKKEPVTPDICFVIPSYNEEKVIVEKLENTLKLDYPEDKIKIVVISDSSTDSTDAIVKKFTRKYSNVNLLRQVPRQGRTAAINLAARHYKAEIFVYSDANVILACDALKQIAANFADPTVGAVTGQLVVLQGISNPLKKGIKSYWSYEQKMRLFESSVWSLCFISGSLNAVRGSLVVQMPEDVTDDHYTPSYLVQKGFRSVMEPRALAFESPAPRVMQETEIRARNFLMGVNFLRELPRILNIWKHPWFFLNLLFRKILRWFSPLFLILALVAAMLLIPEPACLVFLVTTGLLTVATLVMLAFKSPPGWLSTVGFFLLSQVGLVWGIASYILGKRIRYWNPPR